MEEDVPGSDARYREGRLWVWIAVGLVGGTGHKGWPPSPTSEATEEATLSLSHEGLEFTVDK